MATLVETPMSRLYKNVLEFYLNNPHLIASLLQRIGAENIKEYPGEIRCCCPIHRGNKAQSFAVWYDRGRITWKCHTDCADKGSLAKLLMKRYHCDFNTAVGALCRFAGLKVDDNLLKVSRETLEKEEEMAFNRLLGGLDKRKAMIFPETMVQFAVGNFRNSRGHQYMMERQFPDWLLQQFEIGFVPAKAWTYFDDAIQRPKGWFEDRVAFPFRNLEGYCVGFSGRRLDDQKILKYKTLSGTSRSLMLYGLHFPMTREAVKRSGTLHIVEGFTDVMRGHLHKCHNIASPAGTELAPEQIEIIESSPIERVVFYYDADGPGYVAAQRMGEQLMNKVRVEIANPPAGKDPDELYTYEEFWTPLVQARPFTPTPKE